MKIKWYCQECKEMTSGNESAGREGFVATVVSWCQFCRKFIKQTTKTSADIKGSISTQINNTSAGMRRY